MVVLADVLCYLVHKQKWQIPSSPGGGGGAAALSAASYAARHLSFYNPIMCTHMKHVWLRNDKWHSIGNRCAEMWQGQTTRRWLLLKIWIINVRLRWRCITIHHTSSGSHRLWKQDYWYRNSGIDDILHLNAETERHNWPLCWHGQRNEAAVMTYRINGITFNLATYISHCDHSINCADTDRLIVF